MKYNILVIDDHPIVRIALSSQLRFALNGQVQNIVCADGVDTAVRVININSGPWVVTLDLCMPDLHGIDAIRALRESGKVLHIVIVSGLDQDTWEPICRAAGADAFVAKLSDPSAVIRTVERYLEEAQAGACMEEEGPPRLTQRQSEVLGCVAAGLSNKLIARQLGIAEMTVKVHITQILRSLKANNRTHAVRVAQTMGILV